MSGNGNQVPLAPNQRGPGSYPRAPTPHRECYHPSGNNTAYMPAVTPGAQPSAQNTMRAQPTQSPASQQQQDMNKTAMSAHNYVPAQSQSQQGRAQQFYPYMRTQHGARPNNLPRQQQPFQMQGGAGSNTGTPVVWSGQIMYNPMTASYTQQRGQGYYQHPIMHLPFSYPSNPQNHTQQYYIPAPNIGGNGAGRSNASSLVGQQGAPATLNAPPAGMQHNVQPNAHMHQIMPAMRLPPQKRTHRLAIIDPATNQDIFLSNNDNSYVSSDSSERQTPQPETTTTTATNVAVEEFSRKVHQAANSPSVNKPNDYNKSYEPNTPKTQSQTNSIISINNNIMKSDILTVNENKVGPDVAVEPSETPVVSAISDSPVIVPKLPTNLKQTQKNSEPPVQPFVVDTKIMPAKGQKHKNKPVVPQLEEVVEKKEEPVLAPQPQRQREPRESKPKEAPPKEAPLKEAPLKEASPKEAPLKEAPLKEAPPKEPTLKDAPPKANGPTSDAVVSQVEKVDNLPEVAKPQASQSNTVASTETTSKSTLKQKSPPPESKTCQVEELKSEAAPKIQPVSSSLSTAIELLSASIEKVAKELPTLKQETPKEISSAIEAQAKLTQSITSCTRINNPESKMKDINLNNKPTDPDTANGNNTDSSFTKTDNNKDEINKNDKATKNSKNLNKKTKNSNSDSKETESYENGKNETDKFSNMGNQDNVEVENDVDSNKDVSDEPETNSESAPAPVNMVPVLKYKYSDDQWSPMNKSGKKCYDIDLLKQIRDDPLSKHKLEIPSLEACKVVKETMPFNPISRPINDSLLPSFAKNIAVARNTPRDPKKGGMNLTQSGKGSIKMPNQSSGSSHKSMIHVSLLSKVDVKLNESENAWKPNRLKKENISEEDLKTEELYKKFRGILNKLTPQKFDTLMDRVKSLEINNQRRLEGVIDLIFKKAIDEPNFSEAYANMCNKLSKIKVPADNASSTSEQYVNFRVLILNKCQKQFVTDKTNARIEKLEKELTECTDPIKRKEVSVMLDEENRKLRVKSVGNVRFIGELYKLKMLTSKIMMFCMDYLIDKLEEEKLECLCKLLTTIGEQVESEIKGQLDIIFKRMQDIVDRKSNKISSRVRFMLQDVIELRRRRWVVKSVVDSQPKMMDQIQKEAEQHQRQIELLNSAPMSGYRRDDGGRGKRGDNRRQNSNSFIDSNDWKTTTSTRSNYAAVNKTKLMSVTSHKNLSNIKLAPTGWASGSGAKATSVFMPKTTNNMYSALVDNIQTDSTSLRSNKDVPSPTYSKGASIERSTFNSRGDSSVSGSGSRSGSIGRQRSNSGNRNTASPVPPPPADTASAPTVVQEPLSEEKKDLVGTVIDLYLNEDKAELVADVTKHFPKQNRAAFVTEILNLVLDKYAKKITEIAEALLQLISKGVLTVDDILLGCSEIFESGPDLYIDVPMLYDYLGKVILPFIEKKHITLAQIHEICGTLISVNHGHILLKVLIKGLKESMGPSFIKSKWQESGLELKQWMTEDQVEKFVKENEFEFLEGSTTPNEDIIKKYTPAEAQSKLLQLMNSDESIEVIKGWVQDNLGKESNEDWFMKSLIQSICEHALFRAEDRSAPHFNPDRMTKYSGLINEFGESKKAREENCLIGIQRLIHRLEHPQGLTLDIFQYLHEQYLISVDGFTAWSKYDMEPEGKGVILKALTSFFTSIEADNEDSCSED